MIRGLDRRGGLSCEHRIVIEIPVDRYTLNYPPRGSLVADEPARSDIAHWATYACVTCGHS